MRGVEIEVELQKRCAPGHDQQLVVVGQYDPERCLRQRDAIQIGDDGGLRYTGCFDDDLGVAVVEADHSGDVGSRRNRSDRDKFGQIDIIREIDPRLAGQRLDHAPVGSFEPQ